MLYYEVIMKAFLFLIREQILTSDCKRYQNRKETLFSELQKLLPEKGWNSALNLDIKICLQYKHPQCLCGDLVMRVGTIQKTYSKSDNFIQSADQLFKLFFEQMFTDCSQYQKSNSCVDTGCRNLSSSLSLELNLTFHQAMEL